MDKLTIKLFLLPGDFNICLDNSIGGCQDTDWNCTFPKCTGVTLDILAEPSTSLWFNLQLLCYIGVLFFSFYVMFLEEDDRFYMSAAARLNGTFDFIRHKTPYRIPCLTLFFVVLGGLYTTCLIKDDVREVFVIYDSYQTLAADWMDLTRDLITSRADDILLQWFCDSLNGDEVKAVLLTYSLKAATSPLVAVFKFLYMALTISFLLMHQSKKYDFINADILMTHNIKWKDDDDDDDGDKEEEAEGDDPYSALIRIREAGRIITRSDVDQHLHHVVFLPFMKEVYRCSPDLIPMLFNQCDAMMLIADLCDEEEQEGRKHGSSVEFKESEVSGSD